MTDQPVEYTREQVGMEPQEPVVIHELGIHLHSATVARPTRIEVVPRVQGRDWKEFSTITFVDERDEATMFLRDPEVLDQLEARIAEIKKTQWYIAARRPDQGATSLLDQAD